MIHSCMLLLTFIWIQTRFKVLSCVMMWFVKNLRGLSIFAATSKLWSWSGCASSVHIPIHKLNNNTCHRLKTTRNLIVIVCSDTFQSLLLRRCWMSGDPSSVPLMSPCKEQSATLSSFYLQLCLQSCTTRGSSKKLLIFSYVWLRSKISLQSEGSFSESALRSVKESLGFWSEKRWMNDVRRRWLPATHCYIMKQAPLWICGGCVFHKDTLKWALF